MFSGIVEAMGTVLSLDRQDGQARLVIGIPPALADVQVGDSVAVDGACLTATAVWARSLAFDVGPETLRRTVIGDYRPGHAVNLERSLAVGDRLGGHFVTGHVDGVGRIALKERRQDTWWMEIEAPEPVSRYLLPQGSVAVDGVSLTVVSVVPPLAGGAGRSEDRFGVMIIPHTAQVTALGRKGVGEFVNLEADLLGKYVDRLLEARFGSASSLGRRRTRRASGKGGKAP